jgi:hypothetical protein
MQDPMSEFYETLCTGLDWIDDINMENLIQNNSGLSWKSRRKRKKSTFVFSNCICIYLINNIIFISFHSCDIGLSLSGSYVYR